MQCIMKSKDFNKKRRVSMAKKSYKVQLRSRSNRNNLAKSLQNNQYRNRIVADKTKYNRKGAKNVD